MTTARNAETALNSKTNSTKPIPQVKSSVVGANGVSAHAYLVATVNAIPLRTIMEVTETKGYGDLGFDTAISGPVKVEWGGPVANVADTVWWMADLKFHRHRRAPQRARSITYLCPGRRKPTTTATERSWTSNASYLHDAWVFDAEASGMVGVNKDDPLTDLSVNMTVRDLGEFDQLLQTLGFRGERQKGHPQPIPVVLHGRCDFHGTARDARQIWM